MGMSNGGAGVRAHTGGARGVGGVGGWEGGHLAVGGGNDQQPLVSISALLLVSAHQQQLPHLPHHVLHKHCPAPPTSPTRLVQSRRKQLNIITDLATAEPPQACQQGPVSTVQHGANVANSGRPRRESLTHMSYAPAHRAAQLPAS